MEDTYGNSPLVDMREFAKLFDPGFLQGQSHTFKGTIGGDYHFESTVKCEGDPKLLYLMVARRLYEGAVQLHLAREGMPESEARKIRPYADFSAFDYSSIKDAIKAIRAPLLRFETK